MSEARNTDTSHHEVRTFFSDVSRLGKIRLSGESSPEFVKVMTTVDLTRLSSPGKVAPALILNGEGYVLDLIMLSQTGEFEYLVVCNPDTSEELTEWLQAHAKLTTPEGVTVFEDIAVEDTSDRVATFALYGPDAQMILSELSGSDIQAQLGEDDLTTIIIGQLPVLLLRWPFLRDLNKDARPLDGGEVFEVHLPSQAAEDFEQILLGFVEIDPEGYEDYRQKRQHAHTWFDGADEAAYHRADTPALKSLMRASSDFVGAKALGLLQEH